MTLTVIALSAFAAAVVYLVARKGSLVSETIRTFTSLGFEPSAPEIIREISPRPLNLEKFNAKFVAANEALAGGNTDALTKGIRLLVESLNYSGQYTSDVLLALKELPCAPYNRDGTTELGNWALCGQVRNQVVKNAWPHVESINNSLKSRGLGWKY